MAADYPSKHDLPERLRHWVGYFETTVVRTWLLDTLPQLEALRRLGLMTDDAMAHELLDKLAAQPGIFTGRVYSYSTQEMLLFTDYLRGTIANLEELVHRAGEFLERPVVLQVWDGSSADYSYVPCGGLTGFDAVCDPDALIREVNEVRRREALRRARLAEEEASRSKQSTGSLLERIRQGQEETEADQGKEEDDHDEKVEK